MYSTFHGLETARRAMTSHQAAIYTTGNNIANANTEGYSRQRVNFAQETPFPNPGLNAPRIPGHLGTGVKADFIQRIRENYLDIQYRGENSQASYWETSHDIYTRIEDLLNEPSESGIARTMDRFWQSLQDLADHPGDEGARSVVKQRGIALADTFNYISSSLEANKNDLESQIDTTKDEVNSLLKQISDMNGQIARVEPHGHMPNKLYDERDLLIDRLSGMMNIEVERNESKGQAQDAAQGTVNIYLLDENGNRMAAGDAGEEVMIVDGNQGSFQELSISVTEDDNTGERAVTDISLGSVELDNSFLQTPGKVRALVEGYGYQFEGDTQVEGTYPGLMSDLDAMVQTFANEFNDTHKKGYGLEEKDGTGDDGGGISFFTIVDGEGGNKKGAAKNIRVSDDILNNLNYIAAAVSRPGSADKPENAGDGSNALELAKVKDDSGVQGTYQGIIGNLAVETMEAGQMKANTANLRDSIDSNRKQVSSVSLDEEMTNLIQFQHAFNAAARNITMVDEMLDRIINNMGIVGR